MAQFLPQETIDFPERQRLLASLPCFNTFSPNELADLISRMSEIRYAKGEVIVTQDTVVDSVFIIVEGAAEINRNIIKIRKITKKKKIMNIPVAILEKGEAIGLNDTGFYSSTGLRTANVIALTDILLLKLELTSLQDFFKIHPNLKTVMIDATEKMLRIQLIKQSLPFSHLSSERVEWLSKKIEAVSVEKNQLIFKEGETGDRSYLIRKGQVEISTQTTQGIHQLAILKSPTLFGEATLITHTTRNATAKAASDCELLELKHNYLTELLETDDNVANMFMTLMIDRSRPIKNTNVTSHPRVTADGQKIVILKNALTDQYFKLSAEGWFIWQQLNGERTMQEITMNLADQFNLFAPNIVAALLYKLTKNGFIENIDVAEHYKEKKSSVWIQFMIKAKKILEAKIAIGDAEKWLTPFYNKFAYLFFTRLGKIFFSLLMLLGFIAFIFATPQILHSFKSTHDTLFMIIILIPFTVFSVILHELGHALATKSYGFEVHYMGVGWYWFGPVAFTDTSDMWLSTQGPRIIVNLAGIFADFITAGVSALLVFAIPNTYIQCFLWLFALYTYLSAFRMLSPLQDLDGYYVLMDLFEKPRLRKSAVLWLMHDFPKAVKNPRLLFKDKPSFWYWVACIIFILITSMITLIVQGFIFKIIGLHSPNPLVSLTLPFLVIIIFCLGIIAEIRQQKEEG